MWQTSNRTQSLFFPHFTFCWKRLRTRPGPDQDQARPGLPFSGEALRESRICLKTVRGSAAGFQCQQNVRAQCHVSCVSSASNTRDPGGLVRSLHRLLRRGVDTNALLSKQMSAPLTCTGTLWSESAALGTSGLAGHLHLWDKAAGMGLRHNICYSLFQYLGCLPGKFSPSHYDTENERGSIVPQDGPWPAKNNIGDSDISCRWQLGWKHHKQYIWV